MGWLLRMPFSYSDISPCCHGESVSSVAVVAANWETCYIWRELFNSQLLSPGGIHCGESGNFSEPEELSMTLECTQPSIRVPRLLLTQVFITLSRTYFSGILVCECTFKCVITCCDLDFTSFSKIKHVHVCCYSFIVTPRGPVFLRCWFGKPVWYLRE